MLVTAACTQTEAPSHGLKDDSPMVALDSLMQQQPDSALAVLQTYLDDGTPTLSMAEQHYAHLMFSEACFKERHEIALVEEVVKATAFFDSLAETNPEADDVAFLQARAHYMNAIVINHGIIFEDDSITMRACQHFYQALNIMESHFAEDELTGHRAKFTALVDTRLANIYSDKFLIEPTIYFYKSTLAYKKKSTPSNLSNTLFFLGYEFEKAEQYDSALYYYDLSIAHMQDTTGVLYRNVIDRKALSSYHIGHDGAASINALKRIAAEGQEFEKSDRYLGIGYLYTQEKQYDSAIAYLSRVFNEAPSLFLKTQSAEQLYGIYEQLGDTEKADEYARFVTQNTPPEFATKADEWRFIGLFQDYMKQKQEQTLLMERQTTRKHTQRLVVALIALLSVLAAWLIIYRRRHKQTEAEKEALHQEKEVLSGRLQQQGEALSAMRKEMEAASFVEEPVCRQILQTVHEQQFKSKVDYIIYKDCALSKEQLLALREAADRHFNQFTRRIKESFPALTKGDIDYCCLYLLGLDEADVAALMQRAFNTVCERSRKLKGIFGSNAPLSATLRNWVKEPESR